MTIDKVRSVYVSHPMPTTPYPRVTRFIDHKQFFPALLIS